MDGSNSPLDDTALAALEDDITRTWGHVNAATYRFLALVASFDRAEGWSRHGLANCAQWLNWQCGIGTVAAREKVRVARALEALPRIAEAFRLGRISYSKVRAMTRVATPAIEDDLLNVALHGTAVHVERLVRKFRHAERIEEARHAELQHRTRYLDCHYDEDGALVLSARLPPEIGAILKQAIEAAEAALKEPSKQASAGGHDSAESSEDEFGEYSAGARRADALRLLAEQYLAAGAERQPAAAERFRVVVHVDAQALSAHADACNGHCEIEDGPALALDTARRLACDANVVALLENREGEVLDVGRRTRAISYAMRRALQARDGGCRFPGCERTRFTEGHHVRHWADGGHTKLSNLVTLCGYHHRLVHEGGFGLRATDDGLFVFSRPDGGRIGEAGWVSATVSGGEAVCSRADAAARFRGSVGHREAATFDYDSLAAAHADLGLLIDADTARTRWRGEPMDYGLAAEALWRGKYADRHPSPGPG